MKDQRLPWIGIVAVLITTAIIWWSRMPPPGAHAPRRPVDRKSVEERAHREFAAGRMFKPRPRASGASPPTELCPLLLVEQTDLDGEAELEFGVIREMGEGAFAIAPGPPTVYVDTSSVHVQGRDLPQHVFLWWLRHASPSTSAWKPGAVRVTFDEDLLPRIWEVLVDSSEARPIFVSQALEKQALAAHGKPLPGRRFAIEASPEEWPEVIVPRLLHDAPQPLGPWIYIEEPTLEVSTLLCRCMPAQVRSFVDPVDYEVVSLSQLGSGQSLPLEFWLAESSTGPSAHTSLRLPAPADGIELWLRLPPFEARGERGEATGREVRSSPWRADSEP